MILNRTKQFLSDHRFGFFCGGLVFWLLIMWLLNFEILSAVSGLLLYFALFFNILKKYILLGSAALGLVSLVCFFVVGLDSVVGNYTLVITFYLLAISSLVVMRELLIKKPRWVISFSFRQETWLAVLILIFISFFLVQPILSQPGYSFSGDFAFPFSLDNYWQDRISTWSVSHGANVFGDLGHLFYLAPSVGLAVASGGGMPVLLKILVVIPYLAAGLGMFFLARKIFRSIYPNLAIYCVPAAMVAACIYQFNPWLIDHQAHYFLQVGYAFLPIIILFTLLAWEQNRFHWVCLAAFFFATTTVTPHYMFYTVAVLLIAFLVHIFADLWRHQWIKAAKRLGITLAIITLAIIFASFWLWPLASVQLRSAAPLAPDYVLRMDDIIAANAKLSWPVVFQLSNPKLQNPDSYWLWQIAGFGLPALAVAGFVINYRRRWALAILLVLLGAWSIPAIFIYLPGLYSNMIYRLPFSWVFHDPSRPLGLVCLGYGLLTGLFLLGLIARQQTRVNLDKNHAK